ncbi:MAG: hypothetical protein NXI00_21215 [Cytophagales bacterium]|nr:hypothetical protein [Cytophagales bacterium]
MRILDGVNHFFDDYVDELIILLFTFPASLIPGIREVLDEIGWNLIHFYIGVGGQLTALLIMYVRGQKSPDVWWERIGKGVASLLLGGIVAMVIGEYFNVTSTGALFFTGAAFQWMWDLAIEKIKKQFGENTPFKTFADGGEDRPRDPRP